MTTTTESYEHGSGSNGGAETVHRAVHSPAGAADGASNARPCTRVRESSGDTAQSQAPSAPAVDLHKDPAPITWSERLREIARLFAPPDFVSEDRPSLKKVWAHAAHGDWTNKTGLPRRLGQIDALFIGVPFVALFYMAAWTVERPSRRWAAVVLLVLLAQVPPLSWLI